MDTLNLSLSLQLTQGKWDDPLSMAHIRHYLPAPGCKEIFMCSQAYYLDPDLYTFEQTLLLHCGTITADQLQVYYTAACLA